MTKPLNRVRLEHVAERAGVSRALASLALRGQPGVLPEKRKLILQAAAELNYVPNLAARSLASNGSRTIGVVVREIESPFLAALAKAIDKSGRKESLSVLLSISAEDDASAEASVQAMLGQVAGVILIDTPRDEEAISRIALQVPTIYLGRHLMTPNISCVSNDDDFGARSVARHLLSLGHRKIAHITGGSGSGARRRMAGFEAELAEQGVKPMIVPGDYSIDAGAQGVDALLKMPERPTAVFAANDQVALGALNRLLSAGLSVPGDMAVVGYDDMPLAATEAINLTTVRQPIEALADRSIAAILDRIANPEAPATRTMVSPELVVRRSTKT
jgi:DNA-binding LacI/PurR family transcriptional regulator